MPKERKQFNFELKGTDRQQIEELARLMKTTRAAALRAVVALAIQGLRSEVSHGRADGK